MTRIYSTKQAAEILGLKPDTLQRAVWSGKVGTPQKVPGGAFGWTDEDIERASWVLNHKSCQPEPERRSQGVSI